MPTTTAMTKSSNLPKQNWVLSDAPSAEFLDRFSTMPRLVQLLLWRRGLRLPTDVEAFLHPDYEQLGDPFAFSQMDVAVDRLVTAIRRQQSITIYGDYDADGVSGTAVMFEALKSLGAKVDWYLPERLSEGYGLNIKAIEMLSRQGTELLVTIDCGTSNLAEVQRAKALKLDVIILDHHHEPPVLPPADAIINPVINDELYPDRHLSSAGVAYTVVRALVKATDNGRSLDRQLSPGWEKWLLDLVAISTVADMMPLRGENRTLVRYGLLVLRKTRRPGLRALLRIIGAALEQADEYTIGFLIGPRLNAAGRLHHASLALRLLIAENEPEATRLAEQLQAINHDRQRLTEMAMAEALEQVDLAQLPPAITAYAPHWSPGILGLVAGRLSERLWRPVLVMAENDGQVVGSGRSVPGFNIMEVMDAGREHFLRFGGHPGACGFTLADLQRRTEFEAWFLGHVGERWDPSAAERTLTVDGVATLDDIEPRALDFLEQLGPYGIEHTRPQYLLEGVRVIEAKAVGAELNHLRLTIRQGKMTAKCIGFRLATRIDACPPGSIIDVVVEPSWNVWQGRRTPQLKIVDFRPHP